MSGVARGRRMPPKMEKFLQIAPHSLAIVLGPAEGPAGERSEAARPASPAQPRQLARHHIGYEIFADFKAENMQHFWNKKVTAAVAETFFLGWIDEQVLLIQGKEEHLEALREGWSRRALRPPSGFHIRCLGESGRRPPCPVLSRRGNPPIPPFPPAAPPEPARWPRSPRAPAPLSTPAPLPGRGRQPGRVLDWGASWHLNRGSVPWRARRLWPAGGSLPGCPGEAVPAACRVGGGAGGSAEPRPLRVCGSHLLSSAGAGGACADAGEVERQRSGSFGWQRARPREATASAPGARAPPARPFLGRRPGPAAFASGDASLRPLRVG